MIDRRAFFISGALLVLMLVVTAWRLALLPDWTHVPYFLPGSTPTTRNALVLLIAPLCVVFVGGTFALRPLFSNASPEAIAAWKHWGSPLVIIYSAICAALQFFILARSLGLGLALDPVAVGRAGLVLLAALIIVFANYMPKLPQAQSRFKTLDLDPARRAQSVRFTSTVLVLTGVAVIIVAVFIASPAKTVPLVFFISATAVVLSFAHTWQLRRQYRREQSGP